MAAERARRGVFLAFGSVAENHRAHYALLDTEERDGKVWDVVRVEFGGPDTYDLFIAPATGELWGERITEDRKIRFVRYSDWRSVSGVRMPFAQEQTGSNAADDLSQHAKSIQINVQTRQALFSRPVETITRKSEEARLCSFEGIDLIPNGSHDNPRWPNRRRHW